MKKIFLGITLVIFLSSCQFEPNEIQNLSEEQKYEILKRGYIFDNSSNTEKNTETMTKEQEDFNSFSSKNEILKSIKGEFRKAEIKAILEVKIEIKKIRIKENKKIENSLKQYSKLRKDLIEKYRKKGMDELNIYLKNLENKEIMKSKIEIKKLMDIEINKYK